MATAELHKAYHHGDLHEKLLTAGEDALAEMPVEAVSLREIARRAGVSHAAPKHHFPTMGHLLGEIAARGFTNFVKALSQAADDAPEQRPGPRLLAMGRAYFRFAERNPATYRLMFGTRDHCVMTPHLVEASFAAWNQLHEAVAAITGPHRADAGAVHVWSSVHGLSMLKLAQRLPPDIVLHNVEEQKLRMMMAGLATEK
ncbi:MAG: TetR/AcrR family transcriptional regulator [Aestuariivirga sp.]